MTTAFARPPVASTPAPTAPVTSASTTGYVLAVSRIALGFIFLWAFLDKMFGLGYSTSPAKAWVNGGSPTSGFLGHVEVGPLRPLFTSLAGSVVVDALFMLGMFAVGVALILGVGLRIAAAAATVIMLGMWAAEWPLSTLTFEGQPSGSTNPVVDYHLIYALLAIVLAVTAAGRVWGLGRVWESTSLVRRLPWLT
jgi:thiosulfate dehydrogenase [quinone] large subunit